jgi:hypothetical protein
MYLHLGKAVRQLFWNGREYFSRLAPCVLDVPVCLIGRGTLPSILRCQPVFSILDVIRVYIRMPYAVCVMLWMAS